jgi:hypothetical protein
MNFEMEIDEINQDIYDYKISIFTDRIIRLLENISQCIQTGGDEVKQNFNSILNYINISLENKDYLVLADILKYELKKFIEDNSI